MCRNPCWFVELSLIISRFYVWHFSCWFVELDFYAGVFSSQASEFQIWLAQNVVDLLTWELSPSKKLNGGVFSSVDSKRWESRFRYVSFCCWLVELEFYAGVFSSQASEFQIWLAQNVVDLLTWELSPSKKLNGGVFSSVDSKRWESRLRYVLFSCWFVELGFYAEKIFLKLQDF